MMIDSEILHQKLNDKAVIDWIDNDKSPNSYKQGFLDEELKRWIKGNFDDDVLEKE